MKVAFSASALAALVLFPVTGSVALADIGVECREEAELYSVPPEQLQEYIDGCILSRGGYPGAAAGEALPDAAGSETGGVPVSLEQPGAEPVQEAGYGAQ